MALALFQVAVGADTGLPRDRIVNTLSFNVGLGLDPTAGVDWQDLCHDLADVYKNHWHTSPIETTVTAYNHEGSAPHYPLGTWTNDVGNHQPSASPREVALCLSFYADHNTPRHRGRIYLCPATAHATQLGTIPTETLMQKALDMATEFKNLGGANVDWQVWSKTDNTGRNVQEAYVDNEWDTVRSRGFRATTRFTAHIGE